MRKVARPVLSASSALLSKCFKRLPAASLPLYDQHSFLAFSAPASAHHTLSERLDRVWPMVGEMTIFTGVFLRLVIHSVQDAHGIRPFWEGRWIGNDGLEGRIDYTLRGTSRLP